MWQAAPDHTRDYYVRKAADVKADLLRQHPEYRYQPRKSSEKKRRMTKNKQAALVNQTTPAAGTTVITTNAIDFLKDLENIHVPTFFNDSLPEDFDELFETEDGLEVAKEDAELISADLVGEFEEEF